MTRMLFWLAVGLGLWWFMRVWLQKRRVKAQAETKAVPPKVGQALLPCAHCGAHTAPELGLWHNGQFYCGHDHAQKGGKDVV